ncbi:unnamed protein product [Linum tenue]|uniref:Uncharacterized protein n=1 Tax=Linum tenue TaxID=586396 RepID=A0AAV0QE68_9ROSI|nr:unnamed protein product [Linum tenue]
MGESDFELTGRRPSATRCLLRRRRGGDEAAADGLSSLLLSSRCHSSEMANCSPEIQPLAAAAS